MPQPRTAAPGPVHASIFINNMGNGNAPTVPPISMPVTRYLAAIQPKASRFSHFFVQQNNTPSNEHEPEPVHTAHPMYANMQPSKSHNNLADLPTSLENLDLNSRTASSTPAARNRFPSSRGASMLTPPVDAMNADPFSARVYERDPNLNSNMYLESKDEDDVFGGGARLPETGHDKTLSTGQELVVSPASKITPRADRLTEQITPHTAQGVLPPEACVFVANLSVQRTDEQLEESVHEAFDKFGTCVVKIRRDKHKHPFALVQYYTTTDADAAFEGGKGVVVDGRPVRTEYAEARRSIVLSRVSGGPISQDEAEALLGQYGPIAEMHPTTHADARNFGVPEGMWIKFAYYLDGKDAVKLFPNTSSLFRIMEPPNLELRTRPNPVARSPPIVQGLRSPRSNTDVKSIFVGNLPADVTEVELCEIFARYGDIKGCNIIRKPITGGHGFNIFGFVEFDTTSQADAASVAEIDIRGQRIRVEPKEYSARRHTRLQPYNAPAPAAPRPRVVAWGPPTNYQQPAALPYGFQPIYVHQPPAGISPYHQSYGYAATPPNSGYRRRAPAQEEYVFAGSPPGPQHYIPTEPAAMRGYPQYPEGGNGHQHPSRRYR